MVSVDVLGDSQGLSYTKQSLHLNSAQSQVLHEKLFATTTEKCPQLCCHPVNHLGTSSVALAISRYEHPLWVILVPPNKILFSTVPHDSSLSWFKMGCEKFWTSTALYKVFLLVKYLSWLVSAVNLLRFRITSGETGLWAYF